MFCVGPNNLFSKRFDTLRNSGRMEPFGTIFLLLFVLVLIFGDLPDKAFDFSPVTVFAHDMQGLNASAVIGFEFFRRAPMRQADL